MDIYGDRTDWQMKDHDSYDTPLEWPKNAFGEELGGGTDADDTSDNDDVVEPTDKDLDDVEEDEDHDHGDDEPTHDHDHVGEDDEDVDEES